MWKIIVQVGLAVLGGLNTAVPLILNAQQLFPSWPWQLHALAGFVAFAGVMIWMVLSCYGQLRGIENSKPNLVFKKAQEYPFYRDKQAIYHALQIWFVNNPQVCSDNSEAKEVTATITFYDRNTKQKLHIYGCFIKAEAYDFAGNVDIMNKIDNWAPNDEPRKLQIALKWPSDESAYGFAKESFIYSTTQDGREAVREVKKGTHYVKVYLKGTRVYQSPFWFILDNPGQDGALSITKPITKPNLGKEGFPTE